MLEIIHFYFGWYSVELLTFFDLEFDIMKLYLIEIGWATWLELIQGVRDNL